MGVIFSVHHFWQLWAQNCWNKLEQKAWFSSKCLSGKVYMKDAWSEDQTSRLLTMFTCQTEIKHKSIPFFIVFPSMYCGLRFITSFHSKCGEHFKPDVASLTDTLHTKKHPMGVVRSCQTVWPLTRLSLHFSWTPRRNKLDNVIGQPNLTAGKMYKIHIDQLYRYPIGCLYTSSLWIVQTSAVPKQLKASLPAGIL